jgi:ribosomal protein L35
MQSHLLEKKSQKRKRSFRKYTALAKSDVRAVSKLLGR